MKRRCPDRNDDQNLPGLWERYEHRVNRVSVALLVTILTFIAFRVGEAWGLW